MTGEGRRARAYAKARPAPVSAGPGVFCTLDDAASPNSSLGAAVSDARFGLGLEGGFDVTREGQELLFGVGRADELEGGGQAVGAAGNGQG
jgi:hypothetical protein